MWFQRQSRCIRVIRDADGESDISDVKFSILEGLDHYWQLLWFQRKSRCIRVIRDTDGESDISFLKFNLLEGARQLKEDFVVSTSKPM